MFFQSARDCARLTGQTLYTMELFRPVRNIWNQARNWPRASISAAGITWMSRYVYRYPTLMLMNLSPREPATAHWPLFSWPPPHFLVGYQYVVKICNDYVFETRAYSRLIYKETVRVDQQIIDWSTLANCSYTINTGAYHRFIDLDNFEDTLRQVQQAVLAERVVADLALIAPMRGFGSTRMADMPRGQRNVPVERLLHDQYKCLGQCQQQAWGLADRIRIQQAGKRDLMVLTAIRRFKSAYFNYLMSHEEEPISILSLPCDCDWLDAFLERFSTPIGYQELCNVGGSVKKILTFIMDSLSLPGPCPSSAELSGGAFELRPREDGKAVTEEMRRRRGEIVQRFIESLPFPTRRRRPRRQEEPSADESEGSIPVPSFHDEVRATIAEVIRLLQEELTVSARNEQFFNFAMDFYRVMERLDEIDDINEMTIRRWVMYFFVAEHVATTLNYLHHRLRVYNPFSRYVELNLAQLVMRARDNDGHVIYSRIWNEAGLNAFINLMTRISTDLASTVERAGHGELDENEIQQFMADIAYHDNSGDVQEILKQAAMNDVSIDSIDLSFRFKITGPVVFSQHAEIQKINRRVISLATDLRQQLRDLPDAHEIIQLPPDPRARRRV